MTYSVRMFGFCDIWLAGVCLPCASQNRDVIRPVLAKANAAVGLRGTDRILVIRTGTHRLPSSRPTTQASAHLFRVNRHGGTDRSLFFRTGTYQKSVFRPTESRINAGFGDKWDGSTPCSCRRPHNELAFFRTHARHQNAFHLLGIVALHGLAKIIVAPRLIALKHDIYGDLHMPLPSMKTARRCCVVSRSTGQRCQNPAAFGCRSCRVHGARKRETIRSGERHWNHQHGRETKEAKIQSASTMKMLRELEASMKKLGLI